ncbi:MAG TPA: DUF5916 domain-containing protein [Gemmatimonadaceae bacterium]|nr:DUF5916 domain-containing protein [Gemmatimonadaceae bacterium]
MLVPILLLLAMTRSEAPPSQTYDGRQRQLAVRPPRLDGDVVVDGRLDEPQWREAAVLTGFTQFAPVDGEAAADSTRVLVWYSPTAMHLGVRAYESHHGDTGRPAVNATLADRDKIASNDYVYFLLGTFDDGRQATVIGVNPLGVQADGMLVETGKVSSGGFTGAVAVREDPDLSPDFVFQSKGRLTDDGYEVEITVPFKSLRYQPAREQRWGIQVVRRVQHSGYEDTWAPARRDAASFLAQSGRLEGLTDLRRGLVLDLNPVITQRTPGAPVGGVPGTRWEYDRRSPEVGGNVRWGVTNNLTLNGTVKPDFSQVESDAGQFAYDPRNALFFEERRPFFLDGIEQFATPGGLIYTRRIVQPVAATKLTGNVSGTAVAFLSAVDSRVSSRTGDYHPVFNVLRVQRDLGAQSRVGIAYTDKIDGGDYNRVASADARLVFGGIYSAQAQLAGSATRTAGALAEAPLWSASVRREGRAFGARYTISGIDEHFRALSGFISRPGVVNALVSHRYTAYGTRGALVESATGEVSLNGTWQYRDFVGGDAAQDRKLHINLNSSLRGGWRAGASALIESFGFDSALYANYAVERPRGDGSGALDTVAFAPLARAATRRIPNLDWVLSFDTPQFERFSSSVFLLWGHDENFFEWASSEVWVATVSADWRPTDKLRVNGNYQMQQFGRPSDGSVAGLRRIPRLKLEYQIARPVFVRVVGQWDDDRQSTLRDESRTGLPLLERQDDGSYVRLSGVERGTLRTDWLFSYQPNPGTVVFAGYGSTTEDTDPTLSRRTLQRTGDGFFVKLSYLFRM